MSALLCLIGRVFPCPWCAVRCVAVRSHARPISVLHVSSAWCLKRNVVLLFFVLLDARLIYHLRSLAYDSSLYPVGATADSVEWQSQFLSAFSAGEDVSRFEF